MHYEETRPGPRLARFVKCFWSLEYEGSLEPEPIIPDGCVEIVFNLADRFRRYRSGDGHELQPANLIAGQMRESILIGPSGKVRLFGIRFFPGGSHPFFPFEMSELAGRIEPLDRIWRGVDQIADRLFGAKGHIDRTVIAEAELAGRMKAGSTTDRYLERSLAAISATQGRLPVRELAREVGISERGLERRFMRQIGLTPKSYSRIVRFQNVIRSINEATDVLDLAHSFGYYDQSHLIADFRQFSGMSPGAFIERSRALTDIFIAE